MPHVGKVHVAVGTPSTPKDENHDGLVQVQRIEIERSRLDGLDTEPGCRITRLQGLDLLGCFSNVELYARLNANVRPSAKVIRERIMNKTPVSTDKTGAAAEILLVPKCLNWIESRCTSRRPDSEHDSNGRAESECHKG
jgi:hypothetical protein